MGIAELFSSIAPTYDRLNHLLSLNLDRRWRRRLAGLARIPPNARILDACTGTADLALELARRAPGARITGIDFCAEMLEIGRRKAARRPLPAALELVAGDVMRLPFTDRSFDVVSIGFGLRNLPDRPKGLAELVRVLKPGGQLLVLEFAPPGAAFPGGPARFYLGCIVPWLGRRVSGSPGAYRYLSTSIAQFTPPAQVAGLMAAAGLQAVEAVRLSGGIVYLYSGRRPG